MSNCSSGCPTQNHASWGECVKAKSLRIAYCGINGGDATKQRKWDSELQAYRDARAQGIQPAGTTRGKIEQAVEISNRTGQAFDASAPTLPVVRD